MVSVNRKVLCFAEARGRERHTSARGTTRHGKALLCVPPAPVARAPAGSKKRIREVLARMRHWRHRRQRFSHPNRARRGKLHGFLNVHDHVGHARRGSPLRTRGRFAVNPGSQGLWGGAADAAGGKKRQTRAQEQERWTVQGAHAFALASDTEHAPFRRADAPCPGGAPAAAPRAGGRALSCGRVQRGHHAAETARDVSGRARTHPQAAASPPLFSLPVLPPCAACAG
jgi:hypothetical protein